MTMYAFGDEQRTTNNQKVVEMTNMQKAIAETELPGTLSGGIILTTTQPPNSYRYSKSYRHFKNPPQPHMCIRTTTEGGDELFINVLSWTRIVVPQEPNDPIPLYGGMRVLPGSSPIVFAVMANPEVLKDSGRHSKDPEERHAMVELMCDFVEAMNPGVKLMRNAVILKDRDISGELKDVWNAVQTQRDREREEQIMQQRQQQQCHNITTQQLFPKTDNDFKHLPNKHQQSDDNSDTNSYNQMNQEVIAQADQCSSNDTSEDLVDASKNAQDETTSIPFNSESGNDSALEDSNKRSENTQAEQTAHNCSSESEQNCSNISNDEINGLSTDCVAVDDAVQSNHINTGKSMDLCASNKANYNTAKNVNSASSTKATSSVNAVVPRVSKRDKLAGFLPNGCIFPRFKNKHKEKDSKSKDKDKILLNALKKNKDKKVPLEQNQFQCDDKNNILNLQHENNCINNLQAEVQKLDINEMESMSIAISDGANVNTTNKLTTSTTEPK